MSRLKELADAYASALVDERHDDCAESAERVVERVNAVVDTRANLVAEIERVERDAARLDWMEKHCLDHNFGEPFFVFEADGKDIRAAIDAMKEQTL